MRSGSASKPELLDSGSSRERSANPRVRVDRVPLFFEDLVAVLDTNGKFSFRVVGGDAKKACLHNKTSLAPARNAGIWNLKRNRMRLSEIITSSPLYELTFYCLVGLSAISPAIN